MTMKAGIYAGPFLFHPSDFVFSRSSFRDNVVSAKHSSFAYHSITGFIASSWIILDFFPNLAILKYQSVVTSG